MTALSLNALSGGRFILELGASGPQVVEGLHGSAYAGPRRRLQETVEIVRQAFRGEKIEYQGKFHELPRRGGESKALQLECEPQADIPIYLATLGERALEYIGAEADGWLGTSFSPEHANAHLDYLSRGAEQAGRKLGDLDLQVACHVAIGDNVEQLIAQPKPVVAFSLGAMGLATTNFTTMRSVAWAMTTMPVRCRSYGSMGDEMRPSLAFLMNWSPGFPPSARRQWLLSDFANFAASALLVCTCALREHLKPKSTHF